MRNISLITNWNELNNKHETLLENVYWVLSYIEKKGNNKGWEINKQMPEFLTKKEIQKIYNKLLGD